MKKISLLILSISISNFGFSQGNEIKVKFLGNCGLYLTDGNANLYIDFPYKSGAHQYMKYDPSEIEEIKAQSTFIFTHRHADHYSKKLLKQVKDKHQGSIYGNWNINKIEKLNNTMSDFKIEPLKTKHKFTFNHYSYLITWHGKRLYISGDTESAQTIAEVKNIDWAFVPSWIVLDAKSKNLKIDAKKIGVYHLYPTQKATNSNPEKLMLLDKIGEVINIR